MFEWGEKQGRLNAGRSLKDHVWFSGRNSFALLILYIAATEKELHCFGSPVDCIHWVTAAQLTLLEDEMRRMERVNVSFINLLENVCIDSITAGDFFRIMHVLLVWQLQFLVGQQAPLGYVRTNGSGGVMFQVGMMLAGMGYQSPDVFAQVLLHTHINT